MRITDHQDKLPRGAPEPQPLEVFETQADKALSKPCLNTMVNPVSRRRSHSTPVKVPSNRNNSMI